MSNDRERDRHDGPDGGTSPAGAGRPPAAPYPGAARGSEEFRAPSPGDAPARIGPRPPARPAVGPGAAEIFGRPRGIDSSFSHPLAPPPQPESRAVVPPAVAGAFGRPDGVAEPFDGPGRPGYDSAPPASPWWSPDARSDPWRDPDAPARLGGPPGVEDAADPAGQPDESAATKAKRRWQLPGASLTALVLIFLSAVVLAIGGGATGFLLAEHYSGSPLFAKHITLTKVDPAGQRRAGSVADIARRVLPAVVSIHVHTSEVDGTGSGVVIDGAGYILTNNHVVSLAASGGMVRVAFNDQSTTTARIVGRDPKTDLAVVKVDKKRLTVASLGTSGKLVVGDPVLAIGSPLDLPGTVTAGIVSALDRPVHLSGEGSDTDAVIDAIQTDAAINPGNSGGALVDGAGAVVGINTAIATAPNVGGSSSSGNIGVGFAIPIDEARQVAQQLIRTGHVRHPTLGVSTRSVTDLGSRGDSGAQVEAVTDGGAASRAGIREGDVIVALDGEPVGGSEALLVAVGKHEVGDRITLTVDRGGSGKKIVATLLAD
ncbi:MAG: trypsin-like peptidase domain-containing protein [Mycobacteriales bacterium]